RFERLLLPLFWLCAPTQVGASGRFRVAAESCYDALDGGSVIGWRSLHGANVYIRALPASSRRTPRWCHSLLAAARSVPAWPRRHDRRNPLGVHWCRRGFWTPWTSAV